MSVVCVCYVLVKSWPSLSPLTCWLIRPRPGRHASRTMLSFSDSVSIIHPWLARIPFGAGGVRHVRTRVPATAADGCHTATFPLSGFCPWLRVIRPAGKKKKNSEWINPSSVYDSPDVDGEPATEMTGKEYRTEDIIIIWRRLRCPCLLLSYDLFLGFSLLGTRQSSLSPYGCVVSACIHAIGVSMEIAGDGWQRSTFRTGFMERGCIVRASESGLYSCDEATTVLQCSIRAVC